MDIKVGGQHLDQYDPNLRHHEPGFQSQMHSPQGHDTMQRTSFNVKQLRERMKYVEKLNAECERIKNFSLQKKNG